MCFVVEIKKQQIEEDLKMEAKEMIESLLGAGLTEDQIAHFVEEEQPVIRQIRDGKINNPLFKTIKNLQRFQEIVASPS